MDRAAKTSDFLSGIPAELGRAPRYVIPAFAIMGLVSAGLDLLLWSPWWRPRLVDQIGPPLLSLAVLVLLYAACMRMIERPLSWKGFGKGLTTLILMFLPILITLALLASGRTAGILLAVPVVLVALLVMSFLPGWPLLQATSAGWIGPVRAWRATKGLRWQLVMASILIGAINKAAPDLSKVTELKDAALLAAGGGVIAFVGLMTTAAVAVLAWRHMQGVLEQA